LSGPKFFKTQEFLSLQKEWREKLSRGGFADIEDPKGHLKTPDRRTIGFQNRDRIRDFFMDLDHYLTEHPEIPAEHRSVLEMYSEGFYLVHISKECKMSLTKVKVIISTYKKRIASFP
jgi:hypothetical protein